MGNLWSVDVSKRFHHVALLSQMTPRFGFSRTHPAAGIPASSRAFSQKPVLRHPGATELLLPLLPMTHVGPLTRSVSRDLLTQCLQSSGSLGAVRGPVGLKATIKVSCFFKTVLQWSGQAKVLRFQGRRKLISCLMSSVNGM